MGRESIVIPYLRAAAITLAAVFPLGCLYTAGPGLLADPGGFDFSAWWAFTSFFLVIVYAASTAFLLFYGIPLFILLRRKALDRLLIILLIGVLPGIFCGIFVSGANWWLTVPAIYFGAGIAIVFWFLVGRFLRDRESSGDPRVELIRDGFLLRFADDSRSVVEVYWTEVRRIITYKLDLQTLDRIYLMFELSDGRDAIHVSEEWEGFLDLFNPLKAAFPSLPTDWYAEVMQPAFTRNQRLLYEAN